MYLCVWVLLASFSSLRKKYTYSTAGRIRKEIGENDFLPTLLVSEVEKEKEMKENQATVPLVGLT